MLNKYHFLKKLFWIAAGFTILLTSCNAPQKGNQIDHQQILAEANFVGMNSCISCHETEFQLWKNSHHDLAMQKADSASILGNFNNSLFTHKGVTTRFFKEGNDFFVNTQGKDGSNQDFKIIYTFGVFPLQQYIVEFPNGAYQCLDVAWDSEKDKWFHLQPHMDLQPNEWIHWTSGGMRWNTACADCHSTDLRKNYDNDTQTFSTTYSEINVACEACHGPASFHVDYYEETGDTIAGNIPKLKMNTDLSSQELVDDCARCHSRRSQVTAWYDYTGNFLDHYDPQLITVPLYEPDGQILDEDYVWASFTQSKMYHNNISCRDCHDVHSLKLKKTGNALCLDCHITKDYDSPAHHFHLPDTEASQCINCHMSGRYYMGNDFRRDHSFRNPRPDQTVLYGTPNACNGCHDDKSAEWARDFIIEKYGPERPKHFSDLLLKGHAGDRAALVELANDREYPDIARASAVHYFAAALTADDLDEISLFLKDTSALVRKEALNALNGTGNNFKDLISPSLKDESRIVRIAAARLFALGNINGEGIEGYETAYQEYFDHMILNTDFAAGQQNLALHYEATGEMNKAVEAYRKAIAFDDYFNPARMNLALTLYRAGDVKEAEKLYLEVVEKEPDFSYSFYMLGLLYNEQGDIPKALEYLHKACSKTPHNLRAFYNYALLLQQEEDYGQSTIIADKGLVIFPTSEELWYVKILGLLKLGETRAARETAKELLKINPNRRGELEQMIGERI